jgi:hypothetical protein
MMAIEKGLMLQSITCLGSFLGGLTSPARPSLAQPTGVVGLDHHFNTLAFLFPLVASSVMALRQISGRPCFIEDMTVCHKPVSEMNLEEPGHGLGSFGLLMKA